MKGLSRMALLQETKEATELQLMLNMMSRIEGDPEVTQRTLSSELGVAIGLVNTYLKRCIQKGWIKVQNIPSRRYAYYLTPKGFLEKTKLSVQYLTSSFEFVRNARGQYLNLLKECEQRGCNEIALVGLGELAEIASQVAKKTAVNTQVFAAPFAGDVTLTFPFESFEMVIITDVESPQYTFECLLEKFTEDKVLVPTFLHISKINKLRECL